MVEKFTEPGQAEPETVAVAPSAETVQVALTWPETSSSFDVTGVKLVSGRRVLAQSGKLKPGNLKITKKRTKRSLDVRIKNVKRGKLKFKIVAKKVGKKTQGRREDPPVEALDNAVPQDTDSGRSSSALSPF